MVRKVVLAFMLVISLSMCTLNQAIAQTQPAYSLALQGPTWDHSTISVLIVPQFNESWWNPDYLNSTLRAIDEWNEALAYFALNHTDFAYLSQLRMVPEVSNSTSGSFDASISWIEQFGNETCEAGLTRTTYSSSNLITNSTIAFSAYDCRGNILNEVDMQNVALHELGHCWGLGHANYTDDLMYFAYSLNSPVRAISSLDVHGVGTVFRWMAQSQVYNADNQGDPIYSVTLQSSLEYQYLPISANNIPAQSALGQVQTYLDGLLQFILQPEVLIFVVLAVAALVAYRTISRSRRRQLIRRQPDTFMQETSSIKNASKIVREN